MSNTKCGLFVGMATWDSIYLAVSMPTANQKAVALDYTSGCGGPATNAAICYRYLGNRAKLMAVIGAHPLAGLIKSELGGYGIETIDLDSDRAEPPPISSIIVTQSTGERAVMSLNATKSQISSQSLSEAVLDGVDILLADGHQMELTRYLAPLAKQRNIIVAIDGGSWKPGWEEILPDADYAICSANFFPPNCQNQAEVFEYLTKVGVNHIAITDGEKPIRYLSGGVEGAIAPPAIEAVDTLGAGDIFHGAFCHYILQTSFTQALESAAAIAANSCQFFGTKSWMESL